MLLVHRQIRPLSTGTRLWSAATKAELQQPIRLPKNIKPVIGLEVHAQLNIKAKLFSHGVNSSQTSPNSQLDLLDASIPGSLPKLNGSAIEAAIITALGLNCTIQDVIHFDRKNYFYTDMPAGYQVTQYNRPIALNGYIDFIVATYHRSLIAHSQQYDIVKHLYHADRMNVDEFVPYLKRSQIKQLQLEQDSAKTLYQQTNITDGGGTQKDELNNLVDYSRSGAGLLEIVFEPDLTNPHEASSLISELMMILRSLKTCDCELQEGSLRVDANVSIGSIDDQLVPKEVANRVELKNLNSLRSLNKGVAYEIQRQALAIVQGNTIAQESRTYDTRAGQTIVLRAKETALDYRYVPEPSIPPLRLDQSLVDHLKLKLAKEITLPCQLRQVLMDKYKLELSLVKELIDEPGLTNYFMAIMDESDGFEAEVVADFLIYSIANLKSIQNLPIKVELEEEHSEFMKKLSPSKMKKLFEMMFANEISFSIGYETMKCLFTSDPKIEPRELVENFKWFLVSDEQEVDALCREVIKGMKSFSKKYSKRGHKKYLQAMLEKVNELNNNQVSVSQAIKCIDKRLRSSSSSSSSSSSNQQVGPGPKNE